MYIWQRDFPFLMNNFKLWCKLCVAIAADIKNIGHFLFWLKKLYSNLTHKIT